MAYPIAESISKAAHALRPMRIDRDESPIHYTATTFPDGPYQGCEKTIRRMESFGHLPPRVPGSLTGNLFVDVLDADGDILDTLEVSRAGFEYMRRVLRFRRESTELLDAFDALAAGVTPNT